jgi:hypothetical protein
MGGMGLWSLNIKRDVYPLIEYRVALAEPRWLRFRLPATRADWRCWKAPGEPHFYGNPRKRKR